MRLRPQRCVGIRQVGVCRLETNVGTLAVRYGCTGGYSWAELEQAAPRFRSTILDHERAAKLLGIHPQDIDESLPCGLAFTGLIGRDSMITARVEAVSSEVRVYVSGQARTTLVGALQLD